MRSKNFYALVVVVSVSIVFSLLASHGGTIQTREGAADQKDYSGVSAGDLPLDEQLIVARSVKLSSVVNWGEGGPGYCLNVAEAFLLGQVLPLFEDARYTGKPFELFQRRRAPGLYQREIVLWTALGAQQMGLYTIVLNIDEAGNVLEAWSYLKYDYEDNDGNARRKAFKTYMEHPARLKDLLDRKPDSEL